MYVGGHAVGEPPLQPGVDLVAQPGRLVVPVGHREDRHPVAGLPTPRRRSCTRSAISSVESQAPGDLVVPDLRASRRPT